MRRLQLCTITVALMICCLLADTVRAQDYSYSIGSVPVVPGSSNAVVAVALTNAQSVNALQMAISYDPLSMQLNGVSYEGGVLETTPPTVEQVSIDGLHGTVTLVLVLDNTAPLDSVIPPGIEQPLLRLHFTMEDGIIPGTRFDVGFVNSIGQPPVSNRVFVNGSSVRTPTLQSGEVFITEENFLRVRESTASPLAQGHEVELAVLNGGGALQGFSAVISYNPDFLTCTGLSMDGTITEESGAEFIDPVFNNDEGFVILGVLMDALPPFGGQVIPVSGHELVVARYLFDITGTANNFERLPINLVNGMGNPPINNVFVIGNQSIQPQLVHGSIVVDRFPVFLRGDSNGDGDLDIADPIHTLWYLMGRLNQQALCLQAMDSNDDERVNMADPIFTLSYLHQMGRMIPPPFPLEGFDPTQGDPPLSCDL